ncbi:thioesterase family protein [Kineosporia sp. J2-2]|uniref:Thioesterase family protein n=1 Tax=Kineosporia corallincola TaxID=2835133 RepID=A0ABS5TKW1_9ACTN|nr:thioesterase family protein [Kineosporia corallincola]MBT0771727.1 thioesterase family protein [Kineosporia corallincola]
MNLFVRLFLSTLLTRLRPKVSLWEGSRTPFRVLPNDLDVFRHMTNSRYLGLCDLARLDLMVRSGYWAEVGRRGWYPVVTAQTITYRRSLRLWQKFEVHTRLLGFDERSSYLEQTFVAAGQTMARAVVQVRFLRRTGGSVPQVELLESAGGQPAGLELPVWVKEWADSVRISSTPENP